MSDPFRQLIAAARETWPEVAWDAPRDEAAGADPEAGAEGRSGEDRPRSDADRPVCEPEDDRIDLPDFVRPDYPFDLPPYRAPFFTHVFTVAGAPRHCPQVACRRRHACLGGDGPPCFRADRENLHRVLLLWWLRITGLVDPEQSAAALRAAGSRYAAPPARRRRRRGRGGGSGR